MSYVVFDKNSNVSAVFADEYNAKAYATLKSYKYEKFPLNLDGTVKLVGQLTGTKY